MSDEKYTYQIYPHRPIRGVIDGKPNVFGPAVIKLTKEEAIKCIGYGPVYRLMPGESPIRVTGDNIEKVHRASLKATIIDSPTNSTETVEKPQIQEPTVQEEPKEEVPTVEEEPKNEESVVEPIIEEETVDTNEEPITEDSTEEGVEIDTPSAENNDIAEEVSINEEPAEESIQEETLTEEAPVVAPVDNKYKNNNYNNNKKKHNR